MDAAIQEKVDLWLKGNYDQATRDEITRMQKENPNELIESFYRSLEFGTACRFSLTSRASVRGNSLRTIRSSCGRASTDS